MKAKFKRCFSLFICLILLTNVLVQPAFALGDLGFESENWKYSLIYPEEAVATPNVVIIYMHGDNTTGNSIEDLEDMTEIEHPLRYAREGTLTLPDDTIMICPQAHYNGEFRNKPEELEDFIHEIKCMFPDAKLILSGASHGSLATYKIAARGNSEVDGYVFIAGVRPGESKKLSLIPNCMVAFGNEPWLADRGDYSELFTETNITDSEYRNETYYLEETTNNGYIRGPWHHGNTPLIFLEDFFWEWVNNISDN